MANTYYQIFIHLIFAVKDPSSFITNRFRENLHRYIGGIVQRQGHKLLAINSMDDHLHVLIDFAPSTLISDVVREVKSNSSRYINNQKVCGTRFSWQEGYLAFSYSISQVPAVIEYIRLQEDFHMRCSFKKECLRFLERFEIEYSEKYLYEFFELPGTGNTDKVEKQVQTMQLLINA